MHDSFGRNPSANESSLSLFRQSLLGKTVDICKSSIGIGGRRQSAAHPGSPQKLSERPSWETEILNEGKFSVYSSRTFVMPSRDSKYNFTSCAPSYQKSQGWRGQSGGPNDNLASERREYVRGIRLFFAVYSPHHSYLLEVVADTRQNFASSNISLFPPLPVAPGPQTRRPSLGHSHDNLNHFTRPSRRALPADQIFHVEEGSDPDQSLASSSTPAQNVHRGVVRTDLLPVAPLEGSNRTTFSYDSPRPTRRATVLARSPEKPRALAIDIDMTPSKRREKSKSANDLKRLIRPISKVQLELDKRESNRIVQFLILPLMPSCSCCKVEPLCIP